MKHFLQEKEEKCSNDTNPAKLTQKITTTKKKHCPRQEKHSNKSYQGENKHHQHQDDAIQAERTTKTNASGWPQTKQKISTNNQNIHQDHARQEAYKISTNKYNIPSFSKMMPNKQKKTVPTTKTSTKVTNLQREKTTTHTHTQSITEKSTK